MLTPYEKQSRLKLATSVMAVLVIAGLVVVADHLKSKSATAVPVAITSPTASQTGQPAADSSSSPSTSSSSSSSYKDGTYSASSSYYVPHGNESIKVNLTLQDGLVTAVSVTNSEGDPDSAAFQESFVEAYKSYVVGRKIADLQLGVIAGASDTTQGFNDAVSQIVSQAQA